MPRDALLQSADAEVGHAIHALVVPDQLFARRGADGLEQRLRPDSPK